MIASTIWNRCAGPNGESGCVHCGEIDRISKVNRESKGKNKRTRIYHCMACNKQFSATSGRIFHDSHLTLPASPLV